MESEDTPNLSLNPSEVSQLVDVINGQASGHPGLRKRTQTLKPSPFTSRNRLSSTGSMAPSSNTLVEDLHTSAPSLTRASLKTVLYEYRLEGVQRNANENLKSIVRNLEHCITSQDLTPEEFYDVIAERVTSGAYTNPKASKSFTLSPFEEASMMQYLAMECPPLTDPNDIHQLTVGTFLSSLRQASRTHYRMKMSENHVKTVLHISNILTDNNTDLAGLLRYLDGDSKEEDGDEELTPDQVKVAVNFIDGLGDGDGEVSLQELRHAFRIARTVVAQDDPDRRGRNTTERLAKAMKALNISTEDFFYEVVNKPSNSGLKNERAEETSIGQITLFRSLSRLSRRMASLNSELEGFPFADDDVLEIMEFLDPNKDGEVTLEEIKDGLRRVREGSGSDSESGLAARLLKNLESAMVEEGVDLQTVFEGIDADNSGSVNTEELGEAMNGFHKNRIKKKHEEFRQSEERGKRRKNRERKTRSEVVESITKWIADHNIHSIDLSTRDVGVFINFLDPFNDGEIKSEECQGFLEQMKGGARVDHEQEFKAARLLSRCGQSMFTRKMGVFDIWDRATKVEQEMEMNRMLEVSDDGNDQEEKKDNGPPISRNRSATISMSDGFQEDYKEFQVYNRGIGVNNVVRAIEEIVGENTNKDDKKKSATHHGRRGGPKAAAKKKSEDAKVEASKHAVRTAITNIMSLANESVEIFTPSDIVATAMFFCKNPYDEKSDGAVWDWKNTISKEELVYAFTVAKEAEDDRVMAKIALVRKMEDLMEGNGWTFNSSTDACKKVQVSDKSDKRKSGSGPKVEHSHAEVLIEDWIKVCHESPDDQDAMETNTTRRNLEVMKAHKLSRIARVGIEEDVAVGRRTRAGRVEGETSLKKKILQRITKGSTGVRISVKPGVWDKESDSTGSEGAWKGVYTGEAKGMEVADVVDGLDDWYRGENDRSGYMRREKNKGRIMCFTIRCETITIKGRNEHIFASSYTPFVPPPPSPLVEDSGIDCVSVLIPKIDSASLKDSDGRVRVLLELRVEIQKGRDWKEGKCRNLANTVSLLTGGGKRGFRAVKTLTYPGGKGEGNRIKCKVTDLQSACWYHCRYRVRYKSIDYDMTDEEKFVAEEEKEGEGAGAGFKGIGSSTSGLCSCSTKPTVPTPPTAPHFLLSSSERVLSMGGSKTKQGIRVVWDEARGNGYEVKTYVVQVKEWMEMGGVAGMEGGEEIGTPKNGMAAVRGMVSGWGVYKTVYQNHFRQYFVQTCSPFVTKLKFRIAAVNVLGMGPWGDEAILGGEKYRDFFKSSWEHGRGSIGGEGGFLAFQNVKEPTVEKVTGGDIRKRLENEGKGKVIAFGRKVSDDQGLFGGGKSQGGGTGGREGWGMRGKIPTRPSTTLPNIDARTLQLVRNAEVIKEQERDYPVSFEAAMEAMRRAGGDGSVSRPRLMDPRASPSPINYLTQVRREREEGKRPTTAPPRAMQGELTAKWTVDGGMDGRDGFLL